MNGSNEGRHNAELGRLGSEALHAENGLHTEVLAANIELELISYVKQASRYLVEPQDKLYARTLALYKFSGNRTLFFGGDTPQCSTTS